MAKGNPEFSGTHDRDGRRVFEYSTGEHVTLDDPADDAPLEGLETLVESTPQERRPRMGGRRWRALAGATLLGAALLAAPAARAAEVTYDFSTRPTTFQADVPFAVDNLQLSAKGFSLFGQPITVAYQSNIGFEDGTDFLRIGSSRELGKDWKLSYGARLISPSDEAQEKGARDVIDFGVLLKHEGSFPTRTLLVWDTKDGKGDNFALARQYFDGITVGDWSLYGAAGVKYSDIGSGERLGSDWLAGAAWKDNAGLFLADSTKPGFHAFSGFVNAGDVGVLGYGKDTKDGHWYIVEWATGKLDQKAFGADSNALTAEILSDMVIRPLYGDDPVLPTTLGTGLAGFVSGYRDGARDYTVAEVGHPIGTYEVGGRKVSLSGTAGGRFGSGVSDVPTGRLLVDVKDFLPGFDVRLIPSIEGREAQLSVRGAYKF